MPFACLVFDDTLEASMRMTASRIAASSGFVPEAVPYHVPLLGGLHTYGDDEVRQALAACSVLNSPLHGRFVRWEIDAKLRLRVAVEFAADADVVQHLHGLLPRGRPWRSHFLVLGSCAQIASESHAEFLAAVEHSFPLIDGTSTFCCATPRLEYHNVAVPNAPPPPHARRKNDKKPPAGAAAAKRATPHKKWVRPTNATSPMDVLIKQSSVAKTIKKDSSKQPKPAKQAVRQVELSKSK